MANSALKYPELLPEDWVLLVRYNAACDVCGSLTTFRPSPAMHFGDNLGLTTCASCNASLVVHINADNSGGISRALQSYIMELR
jgi:hypothetical protein